MMNQKLDPVTPGSILLTEFMEPLGLSQNKLARELDVPAARVNSIIRGTRRITPDMALRLGRFFQTGPELWLNLQQRYDLKTAWAEIGEEIERRITPLTDEQLHRASPIP
ncbi:MAG TPA: HigA family addiction module antitoxin [bacterium]|nr:HigA family addiction module antitoxin [bacterium]